MVRVRSQTQPMNDLNQYIPRDVQTRDAESIPDRAKELVGKKLSLNTRRSYAKWWKRFEDWGGSLPASPAKIVAYLTENEATHSVSTLNSWAVAINFVHYRAGYDKPCNTALVRDFLVGKANEQAQSRIRQVRPIVRKDLLAILDATGNGLIDLRDRCLLLIGYIAALRRSEIAGIRVGHFSFTDEGVDLFIPISKTDQRGRGTTLGIPFATGKHCPVRTLRMWLQELPDGEDPDAVVFRRIDRGENIHPARLKKIDGAMVSVGLETGSIARIIKRRCESVGFNPDAFSGHSLRAGLITQAALDGKEMWEIRKTSRHKGDSVLSQYIRDGSRYKNTAASGML